MAKNGKGGGPIRPQKSTQGTGRVPSSISGGGGARMNRKARTGNQPPVK